MWWLNVTCVRIKRTIAREMEKARTAREEKARENKMQRKGGRK